MKKFMRLLFINVLAAALFSTAVLAHGVLSSEIEPGIIQFYFDDDTAMSGANVTVYNTSGAEIGVGTTDENGLFDYSGYDNVGAVSARDSSGHSKRHIIGGMPAAGMLSDTARTVVIAVPVMIFTAALVYFFSNKQKSKNNQNKNKNESKKVEVNQNV